MRQFENLIRGGDTKLGSALLKWQVVVAIKQVTPQSLTKKYLTQEHNVLATAGLKLAIL